MIKLIWGPNENVNRWWHINWKSSTRSIIPDSAIVFSNRISCFYSSHNRKTTNTAVFLSRFHRSHDLVIVRFLELSIFLRTFFDCFVLNINIVMITITTTTTVIVRAVIRIRSGSGMSIWCHPSAFVACCCGRKRRRSWWRSILCIIVIGYCTFSHWHEVVVQRGNAINETVVA